MNCKGNRKKNKVFKPISVFKQELFFHFEQATQKAIDFFEMIGAEQKEKRLFYLEEYWTKQVLDILELNLLSPINPEHSCAIATISFNDRKHEELESFLMDQARIHTVGINWHRIHGVRITPHIHTSTKNMAQSGICGRLFNPYLNQMNEGIYRFLHILNTHKFMS